MIYQSTGTDYQAHLKVVADEEARTTTSTTVTINVEEGINTAGSSTAYGYSNFCNDRNNFCQNVGTYTPKTSKNGIADIKCVDSGHCEVGISADVYPLISGNQSLILEVNGKQFEFPANSTNAGAGYTGITIAGIHQESVSFFTLRDSNIESNELYQILKNAVGSSLDVKLSWKDLSES